MAGDKPLQALVLANVIVPDSIERDHGAVIVDLFAEAVRQSREAAH